MHRIELHVDETLYKAIKHMASQRKMTLLAYIEEVLKKELDTQREIAKPIDFSEFSGMWKGQGITQTSLRNKAWN